MKKAMKLVWMVLFALPLISLTACGDDEPDNGISFKDYSNLLGEDLSDILSDKMKGYTPYVFEDGSGVYYDSETNDLGNNIAGVLASLTFFDEDADGNYITFEDCVMVDVELTGFEEWEVINYLTDKYGKSEMNEYGDLQYTKGNMYIWFENDAEDGMYVTYVDKKKFDQETGTKAGNANIKEALKARRAAR